MKHSYGWIPDRPDQRDLRFTPRPRKVYRAALGLQQASIIPPAVDLRPSCPPVYDQGQIGSCTANAIAAAIDFERQRQKLAFIFPSRLFIYYNEREIEGTIASDSGAQIRDGLKTINTTGACREKQTGPEDISFWPYSEPFAAKPSRNCYGAAACHKTLQYLSVAQQQTDMLDCLAQGFPFVFGITVYESFESNFVSQTGYVPIPAPSESVLGGHALLAVGYQIKSAILCSGSGLAGFVTGEHPVSILFRNSWGADWGDAGYGTIPVEYLTNPDLASDFWTIRMEEA